MLIWPVVLPNRTARLVATAGTTDLFEPMTPFMATIRCQAILRSIIACASRSANFRCRIGIQTATTDEEVANTALAPNSASSYVSTVTKSLVSFDPNVANNGDIGVHFYFRVGILYSSTGATVEFGDVALLPSYR